MKVKCLINLDIVEKVIIGHQWSYYLLISQNKSRNMKNLTKEVSTLVKKYILMEIVWRTVCKEEYNGRIARKKPYIWKENRQNQLKFAKIFLN